MGKTPKNHVTNGKRNLSVKIQDRKQGKQNVHQQCCNFYGSASFTFQL